MRPSDIVLDPPRLHRALRIGEGHEPALVQALIAEPAIEALDIAALDGLARATELQRDPARVRPLIEVLARELRAVQRAARPDVPRAFRVAGLPVVSNLGVLVRRAMIYALRWTNRLRLIVWLVIGLALYFGYSRQHSQLALPVPGRTTMWQPETVGAGEVGGAGPLIKAIRNLVPHQPGEKSLRELVRELV